jgi:hypothetical protein
LKNHFSFDKNNHEKIILLATKYAINGTVVHSGLKHHLVATHRVDETRTKSHG